MRQPDPASPNPLLRQSALLWPLLGRHGVRGGWRALTFAGLFIAGSEGLEARWPHSTRPGDLLPLPLLGREAALLLIVLTATLLLGRLERRTLGDYGLPPLTDRRVLRGLGGGFGAASLLVGALAALGLLQVSLAPLPLGVALVTGLEWGLVFLVVALFEELLLRGYLQATLARSIGFWPAAALLSFLFALAHARNSGETPLGLVAVGGFGLFFCYTLRASGDLWMAIGFHAAWDWAQSYFYGVPDSGVHVVGHLLKATATGPTWLSGGTVGPEGSILVFAALGASATVIRSRRSPRLGARVA
jgi:CAAX protease family protein